MLRDDKDAILTKKYWLIISMMNALLAWWMHY